VASIPRGQVMTYGQVARKLSAPQAARAVGMALSRNPWPVLVPCHRVIASTGHMTAFTAPGGLAAKKRMLRLEGYVHPLWRTRVNRL
jgi:methylated-DNA-[protein]-cysteine S-methyltransferase